MKFTLRVEIEADSPEAAEALRLEMVGAAEDFAETQRTGSANVGDVQQYDTPEHAALLDQARDKHALGSDNAIEIYDDARISDADGGAWVEGWVWLPLPEEDEDDDEGESSND